MCLIVETIYNLLIISIFKCFSEVKFILETRKIITSCFVYAYSLMLPYYYFIFVFNYLICLSVDIVICQNNLLAL